MAAACGYRHSAFVSEDGLEIFVCGLGDHGRLGTGDTNNRLVPTSVAGLPAPVRQVAAGDYHTAIVTDAGDLFMCGVGGSGRLGLGDANDRTTPTLVARAGFDGEAVLMVACGVAHTVVATEGGSVYTFGDGSVNQLGHGDDQNQMLPRQVQALHGERIVMVAAGGGHTVALSDAGRVWVWGQGGNGELGTGIREETNQPKQLGVGSFGGEKVAFVASGAAVTVGGRLYCWGINVYGSLGLGDNYIRLSPTPVAEGAFGGSAVAMVACGWTHTLVVTRNRELWACGNGSGGSLGRNNEENINVFERVGVAAGAEEFRSVRVVAAAAGYKHSVAVAEDGALWTWGHDWYDGRLGHETWHGDDETNQLVPRKVEIFSPNTKPIGRCRLLEHSKALAFAMGTHPRLGVRSPVRIIADEGELLAMIARFSHKWLTGEAERNTGTVLLGGGMDVNELNQYGLKRNTAVAEASDINL